MSLCHLANQEFINPLYSHNTGKQGVNIQVVCELTLYQPMMHICVMSSHKPIRIYMEGLILGVNTLYRLFCFFKLFPMVGKGLIPGRKLLMGRVCACMRLCECVCVCACLCVCIHERVCACARVCCLSPRSPYR